MINISPPLTLYLLLHPAFAEGEKYANAVYSAFSRDVNNALARGIGIPVYFRSVSFENEVPLPVEPELAEHTVIVALIDDNIVGDDSKWQNYLIEQNKRITDAGSNHLFLPVANTGNAFKLDGNIPETHYIRLFEKPCEDRQSIFLSSLCHELCRLLYGVKRCGLQPEPEAGIQSNAPVKLFLSHAKSDGAGLAEKLRNRIRQTSAMDSFFDANDIAPGHKFYTELERNINSAVLLVLHTDCYASREWCRKEVILAKEKRRPVIIINALEEVELRSFPYMHNAPAIRYEIKTPEVENKMLDKILFFALLETLRFNYQERYLNYIAKQYSHSFVPDSVLPYPPELFSFTKLKNIDEKKVLYPDPPLGECELQLLMSLYPEFNFFTPVVLPFIK